MKMMRLGKTNLNVSRVGIGGIPIQLPPEKEAIKVIQRCIDLGISYIDTSIAYGTSEERIGKAIRDEIGRSYADIELTVLGTIRIAPDAMTSTEIIDLCNEFADMGFQHVIFNMPDSHKINPIEIIGQK